MKSAFVSWAMAIGLVALPGVFACGGAPPPATPDGSSVTSGDPAKAGGADKDTDGDGVPDSMDKCPDKKEDGLPPEPKDGCPKS